MELAFEASRAGPASCRAGQVSLHSAYDPVHEAERFLDRELGGRSPSCFILSGPCLDYLGLVVRQRFPGALLLSLQHDPRFRDRASGTADAVWYPGEGISREAFLATRLSEDVLGGVQVLAWPPAGQVWPAEAEATQSAIRSVLDRLAASSATLRSFGRRWIWNACRNALLLERVFQPPRISGPVVIAAAGPSLPEALGLLAPYRERFTLFAVSSALLTCRTFGLEPDLVIATDGGYFSRLHLYPLETAPAALAMPLTTLPSASLLGKLGCLILTQGNFPEPELARLLGGGLALPGHGTVSGTALHLASRLGSGPIAVAGMDLANFGDLSHARPHGFDTLTRDCQSRLLPLEGLVHSREAPGAALSLPERPWRSSRSLAIYASALSSEAALPQFAGRLWRAVPSPVRLEGYRLLDAASIGSFLSPAPDREKKTRPFLEESKIEPREVRREGLGAGFEGWRVLAGEATSEFLAGRLPSDERAKELLRSIDLPWWAAACRATGAGQGVRDAAEALRREALGFIDMLEERLL